MPVRGPYPDVEIPAVSLSEFLFGAGPGAAASLGRETENPVKPARSPLDSGVPRSRDDRGVRG
jgi:hypothetical protein